MLAGRQRLGDLIGQLVQCMGQLADRRVMALLARFGQRADTELGRALGQVEHHRRIGEIGIQIHLPGGKFDAFVGALAESTMGQQLGDPGAARLLPQIGGTLPGGLDRTRVGGKGRALRLDAQIGLAQVTAQALT